MKTCQDLCSTLTGMLGKSDVLLHVDDCFEQEGRKS